MYHGIVRRGQQLFVEQLKYLHRHFLIVSLEHLVKELTAGNPPKPNEVVLTFDDGLQNNATVVYPILKYLRTPATFFVCPGLIETGHWLWTHEARRRMHSLDEKILSSFFPQGSDVSVSVEDVIEWMKTLTVKERQAAEARIRQATPDFQPTAGDHEAFDVMSWNDLQALDPELITIGSHTVTHPILTTATQDEINFELMESRQQLETRLDRPVKYFCYPNGANHNNSWLAARQAYAAAVTTEEGMLTEKNSGDQHRLPRIPATKDNALMAWRMHRPGA